MTRSAIITLFIIAIAFLWGARAAEVAAGQTTSGLSQARASLESEVSKKIVEGKPVSQTIFRIENEVRPYEMVFSSSTNESIGQPRNAYGMKKPNGYWFNGGMMDVRVNNHSITGMESEVRILQTEGTRVAYDLVFKDETKDDVVVVRTVVLAGYDALFLAVYTFPIGAPLSVTFSGYPCGFGEPRDRWVHVDGREVQNVGPEKSVTEDLGLVERPWILMTDHLLNEDGMHEGQLGLIYRKENVEDASVTLITNYRMTATFSNPFGGDVVEFILYNFEPMTWQEAKASLVTSADQANTLMDRAFKGLSLPTP